MLQKVEILIALLVSAFCAYYAHAMISHKAMYIFLCFLAAAVTASAVLLKRFRFHAVDALACFLLTMIIWFVSPGSLEGFEGRTKKRAKQTAAGSELDDEDEEDMDGTQEDMEAESREKPKAGAKKEDFGEAHVDLGSTFLKAYSKLKPDQVEGMKRDTKELMDTQKALMTTLSSMGPAVQQGVELIENFKKYFGASGGPGGGLAGGLGGMGLQGAPVAQMA